NMAETLTEFIESLGRPAGFHVGTIFQPEADLITVFFEDEPSFAERVDATLTVYRAFKDNKIVGFELKGVRHKAEEMMASLGLEPNAVSKLRVKLKVKPHLTLLLTFFMKEPLGPARKTYTSIYERAKEFSELSLPRELVDV